MDKIERCIIYIMSPLLLLTVFYTMVSNSTQLGWLYIPIIANSILMFYLELFILPNPQKRKLFWKCIILVIIFNTCIGVFGKDQVYHVFYLLTLFMMIRYLETKYALCFLPLLILLVGMIVSLRVKTGHDFFINWLVLIFLYGVTILGMLVLKYMIGQNKRLELAQMRVIEKNIDLMDTYDQLKRAYDDLEDYTIMKERSHMSREMHDTVGHTLTTTLVELELCKMLVSDQEEVREKLEHVTEQVRRGLSDLRVTVRQLKADLDWEKEIYIIGERLMNYTDIKVRYDMDNLEEVETDTLRCIYRMIQEGITNGIKHGKATAFIIEVSIQEDCIYIEIIDNGTGAIAFKQGFGLTAMRERVAGLKGKIEFESYKDEGFVVKAYLPRRMRRSRGEEKIND